MIIFIRRNESPGWEAQLVGAASPHTLKKRLRVPSLLRAHIVGSAPGSTPGATPGAYGRQLIYVSLSLPSSLSKINERILW